MFELYAVASIVVAVFLTLFAVVYVACNGFVLYRLLRDKKSNSSASEDPPPVGHRQNL